MEGHTLKKGLRLQRVGATGLLLIAAAVHIEWLRTVQKWLDHSLLKAIAAQNPDRFPPPVPWGYAEVAWLPVCFIVSLGLFYLCYLLLRKLSLSAMTAAYLCAIVFLVTVIAQIPSAHYFAAKKQIWIIAIALSASIFWIKRKSLGQIVEYLNRPDIAWKAAFLLVATSSIQRLVELKMGILWFTGDDPLTYHLNALDLAIHGRVPDSTYSPAMPFFLAFFYHFAGVGFLIPRIALILLSAPSLLLLFVVVKRYYGGPVVGLIVLVTFLLNSQYVAFSNGFWNENLFVISLPFLLYLVHALMEQVWSLKLVLIAIGLGFLAFLMTLMRSWMPGLFVIIMASVGYIKWRQAGAKASIQAVLPPFVFLVVFLMLFSEWRLAHSGEGKYVTSNFSLVFLIGNNPLSHGCMTNHVNTYARSLGMEDRSFDEILPYFFEYAVSHPLHIPTIFAKKTLIWFWGAANPKYFSGYYISPNTLAAYYWRIIWFFFSVAGFCTLWKKDRKLPLVVYAGLTVIFVPMMVEHRFLILGFPLQAIAISAFIKDRLEKWSMAIG